MNSSKAYIILGPPGSGKGTQAKRLAQSLGLIYFGTGDLMREEAEKGTPLGLEFKKIWDEGKGKLIGEDLVQKFVGQKIDELDINRGIVFEGYPRTIPQAQHLDWVLRNKGLDNIKVFNLSVNPESLIKRMSTRRICDKCSNVFQDPRSLKIEKCDNCGGKLIQRIEDNPDVLEKRIEVYNRQTAPVINYYKSRENLIEIDGEPPIEEVWKKIHKSV